ncbi:MAG: thiol reductant ABC exporter subunit CydD [Rhodospirillales bacterium 20-64-7]|nr:MAG: thiol reductant ABC exporter subunit CydD [Rhodospirillales bacterium 20-64-7]
MNTSSRSPRDVTRRLTRQGRRSRGALVASIGLGLCAAWGVVVQAVLLAHIVTLISFRHAGLGAASPWLYALGGVALLRAGLAYAAELAAHRASIRIRSDLRAELLDHLFACGPLAAPPGAAAAATLIEGVEALEPYFARYLPQMALCVAVPLAILALVLRLDWISAAVLLVAGPLVPMFMILVGYRAEAVNQAQWEKLLRLGTHFLDVLQGLTTMKLFGRARDEIAVARRLAEDYRKSTMAGLRIAFLTSAVLEFFASLAIALIAVLFGARLIHGHFDFRPAFLVLLLAPEYFMPLRGLSAHYHARMTAIAAAKQIFALLDMPAVRRGSAPAASGKIDISCRNLGFSYAGAPVLSGLNAEFAAGTMTVIAGASGAGKTTLARLLLGFAAPDSGRILVNGQDLAEISTDSWWQCLAWVPQNPRLFQGSIAANLRLGAPEAGLEALREAAAQAGALGFIEALPAGFDTEIGENGAGLSGGQIQRIALARAYLKNPRLLILDEPAASLDPQGEAEMMRVIAGLARGRTVIVIAHRLAMASLADRVLVLSDGRIAQHGTPDALAREPGPYRDLVQTQEAVPWAG